MDTEYSIKLSKNNFNSSRPLLILKHKLRFPYPHTFTDDNLDYIKNKLKLSEMPCSKDAEVTTFGMGFDFDNDLYKIYCFLCSLSSPKQGGSPPHWLVNSYIKGFQVKNNSISSHRTYTVFTNSGENNYDRYKKYRFLDKYDKFFKFHKFKCFFLRMNGNDAHSLHFANNGRFDMTNIGKPIENFCDCYQWDKANIIDFLKKTKFKNITTLSFSSDEIYIYYK